ncbi:MAG TPA: hypothetical protein VHM19_01540 [Polyangiales bacterium]|jgi:hypothetical protein|nr:hypothetical protein [Polyangiales bacterium]
MTAPAQGFAARWERFWFSESDALRLTICRVLFYGGLLYVERGFDAAEWARVDPVFYFPKSFFAALSLSIPSEATLQGLVLLYKIALGLACVGLFTRVASVLAFVTGTYLFAVPQNFGKTHHSDAMLVFILAALALARTGEHGSLDAWLRKLRGRAPAPERSGEYHWPVRFAQVASLLIYFAAGIAKSRTSGLAWASPRVFHNLLVSHHYTHEPLVNWGLYIAEIPWLCAMLGGGTLLFELSAPLALLDRRLAMIIVPALASMQLGIYLVLGVIFRPFMLLLAFWIPWDELWFWLRARWARRSA